MLINCYTQVHENTGVIVYWEITECYKFNLKKVLPILRELYAPKAEGAKDVCMYGTIFPAINRS